MPIAFSAGSITTAMGIIDAIRGSQGAGLAPTVV